MTTDQLLEIRLSDVGGPVITGRQKGLAVRRRYKLDDINLNDSRIKILIPDDTVSVSSSFLLGFLGDSMVQLGSRDRFYSVFEIDSPTRFIRTLDSCIDRALATRLSIDNSANQSH